MIKRCKWLKSSQENYDMIKYHDEEWGRPIYDDNLLFEFLILEGAQAGLSWAVILKKRNNYRLAYDNFNPYIIATYDKKKKKQLLQNPGIIRNKLKIDASVSNAKAFIKIVKEYGSFSKYLWQFAPVNKNRLDDKMPVTSKESDLMSKSLKQNGVKFVGSTICYAFMQAVGMINDHDINCFKYEEIKNYEK